MVPMSIPPTSNRWSAERCRFDGHLWVKGVQWRGPHHHQIGWVGKPKVSVNAWLPRTKFPRSWTDGPYDFARSVNAQFVAQGGSAASQPFSTQQLADFKSGAVKGTDWQRALHTEPGFRTTRRVSAVDRIMCGIIFPAVISAIRVSSSINGLERQPSG